jgi:hypothetical protein
VGELGALDVKLIPSKHRFAPESADNFQELLLPIGPLKAATFSVVDNSLLDFQKFSHAVIVVRDFDGQRAGKIENEFTFFMQCAYHCSAMMQNSDRQWFMQCDLQDHMNLTMTRIHAQLSG